MSSDDRDIKENEGIDENDDIVATVETFRGRIDRRPTVLVPLEMNTDLHNAAFMLSAKSYRYNSRLAVKPAEAITYINFVCIIGLIVANTTTAV